MCEEALQSGNISQFLCIPILLSRLLIHLLADSTLETIPKNNLIVRGGTEAES